MTEWQPIETAPRDGTPFIALNHDKEVWVAKIDKDGRILFRTNQRFEPRKFTNVEVGGETLLREDTEFAKQNERWESHWTIWMRLYELKPTDWIPLPPPPAALGAKEGE